MALASFGSSLSSINQYTHLLVAFIVGEELQKLEGLGQKAESHPTHG